MIVEGGFAGVRNRVVDLTAHFLLSLGDECLTGCFPCGPLAGVIRNGSEDISPSIVFSVDGMAANRLDTLATAVARDHTQRGTTRGKCASQAVIAGTR